MWCVYTYVHMHVFICLCMCTCVCTCVRSLYVCMCIYLCVCVQCNNVLKTREACDVNADIVVFVQQKSTGVKTWYIHVYIESTRWSIINSNLPCYPQQQYPSVPRCREFVIIRSTMILKASLHLTLWMCPFQLPLCMWTTSIQKWNCPKLEVRFITLLHKCGISVKIRKLDKLLC